MSKLASHHQFQVGSGQQHVQLSSGPYPASQSQLGEESVGDRPASLLNLVQHHKSSPGQPPNTRLRYLPTYPQPVHFLLSVQGYNPMHIFSEIKPLRSMGLTLRKMCRGLQPKILKVMDLIYIHPPAPTSVWVRPI